MNKTRQVSLRRFEALGLLPDTQIVFGYKLHGPGHYSKSPIFIDALVDSFPEVATCALEKIGKVWVISLVYTKKDRNLKAYLEPDSDKVRRFMLREDVG